MTLSAIGAGLIVSNAVLVACSFAVLLREARRGEICDDHPAGH